MAKQGGQTAFKLCSNLQYIQEIVNLQLLYIRRAILFFLKLHGGGLFALESFPFFLIA